MATTVRASAHTEETVDRSNAPSRVPVSTAFSPRTGANGVARVLALQQTAGNQAVGRLLSSQRAAAVARDEQTSETGDAGTRASEAAGAPASAPSGGGKALKIEFHAFIPGSLGRPFSSFPHAKDLKNQAAFDADVAAVGSPNSWKPEPTKTEDDVKDPGSARKVWFYSTDERGFGGGASHRVGFKGTVNSGDIGALASKGTTFTHDCSASHRVQSTDTGWVTSSGETGSVDGPHAKTAPVKGVTETAADSGSTSSIETKGAASYAFMPTLSPDIDYKVKFSFAKKATGGVDASASIEHNLFPFYELLVNGTPIWNWSASDTGPTLTNLNRSKTDFVGPWPF